jgi:nucleotide-binding universal stress UspA family protein
MSMKLESVLLATDFSSTSEAAQRLAVDLARAGHAHLHIVCVVPPVTAPWDTAERLTELVRGIGPGVAVETAVLSGRPTREIIRYARDRDVSLIVLGTHGRTGVTRALLGSVAEGVVRMAGRPVLTVPLMPVTSATPADTAAEPPLAHHCIVCVRETEDLICESCRSRIRGETLERKIEAERAGRREMPA